MEMVTEQTKQPEFESQSQMSKRQDLIPVFENAVVNELESTCIRMNLMLNARIKAENGRYLQGLHH